MKLSKVDLMIFTMVVVIFLFFGWLDHRSRNYEVTSFGDITSCQDQYGSAIVGGEVTYSLGGYVVLSGSRTQSLMGKTGVFVGEQVVHISGCEGYKKNPKEYREMIRRYKQDDCSLYGCK